MASISAVVKNIRPLEGRAYQIFEIVRESGLH